MTARWLAVLAFTGCNGQLTAEGEHHHYVVSKLEMPASMPQVAQYAVDLDGDGAPDNRFGAAFADIAAHGCSVQPGSDAAVAAANLLLLVDFQSRDFTEAAAAGVRVLRGDHPSPSPCITATDCGHHLAGTGQFEVSYESRDLETLVGTLRDGTFISGSGGFTVQVSIGEYTANDTSIEVPLLGGRVVVTNASATEISGVIGGAVARDQALEIASRLQTNLDLVTGECGTSPPCQCSTAYATSLLHALDANGDCLLSTDEAAAPFAGIDAADVSIDGVAAVSFGVGFHAVPGAFDEP